MKYFSREGYLNHLDRIGDLEKEVKKIQAGTQDASENGGNTWHDNASYEFLLQRLRVADKMLTDAQHLKNEATMVEYPKSVSSVVLGCVVDFDMDGHDKSYKIIGYGESDPNNNRILYDSPIGMALIGKSVGDYFTVNIVDKVREIEIIDIKPLK